MAENQHNISIYMDDVYSGGRIMGDSYLVVRYLIQEELLSTTWSLNRAINVIVIAASARPMRREPRTFPPLVNHHTRVLGQVKRQPN